MKYLIAIAFSLFVLNAYALTPETFVDNVSIIVKEQEKSHKYFSIVKNEPLKSHYACQASKDVVYFVKYVYSNQQYLYLIKDPLMDYMYFSLRMYKPYLNKKCKL